MDVELPEDVLHIICDELHHVQDLSTLFNLALSSKFLAPLALASLYRTGNQSPAGDDLSVDVVAKWSIYWRSITLASFGETLYPYHSYLRFLDLRDLGNLLAENIFRPDTPLDRNFFEGSLAQFRHVTTTKWGKRRVEVFDNTKIVDSLGQALTAKASVIEVVSGNISANALQDWVPRLSRLQRLELNEGSPLGDEDVQKAIYNHCPNFTELEIYRWNDPRLGNDSESDRKLGSFLSGLPENSLKSFHAISSCGVSTETCLALNHHGNSLKNLEFCLEVDAVPALALLGGCVNIETFKLEASWRVSLMDSQKDVFDDFTAWLARCEKLRDIQLIDFNNAAAALTPLVLNDKIKLESITASAYSQSSQFKSYHGEEARIFHQSLQTQSKTLQSLDIKGQIYDGEEPDTNDAEVFANNVRGLTNLTNLNLVGIMDESFGDDLIIRMVTPLKRLEEISFGGYGISDEVLRALSTLHELKRITVTAASRFTLEGFLDFVDNLGPGNEGLVLSIDNADFDYQLSDEEVILVNSAIEAKVNGTFSIQAGRDPYALEADDSDAEYGG